MTRLAGILCEYNKIVTVLGDIVSANVLAASSTNSASRWICQQWSLPSAVVILMENAHLIELLETNILCFPNIGCSDWIVNA
jgi:hypothetical protein